MATFTLSSALDAETVMNGLRSKDNFDNVSSLNGKPSVEAEGLSRAKTTDLVAPKSDRQVMCTPSLSEPPNLFKQNGEFMSFSKSFQLKSSPAALWLLTNNQVAYLLLSLIALRAQTTETSASGLKYGEALIGDYEVIGTTRQKYRTALALLEKMSTIKIIETCRTRQKSTTATTTKGTKVKLLPSDICDIILKDNNHQNNHRATTEQPPSNQDLDRLDRLDMIDLGKSDFDPKTMIRFKHKKSGHIQVDIQELYAQFLSEGWNQKEISQAIHQMKASDPEISGTIQKYLSTILSNNRNQKEKELKWKNPPKQNPSPTPKPSNAKLPKDKGYYTDEDLSEAPLAKFARQNGLK